MAYIDLSMNGAQTMNMGLSQLAKSRELEMEKMKQLQSYMSQLSPDNPMYKRFAQQQAGYYGENIPEDNGGGGLSGLGKMFGGQKTALERAAQGVPGVDQRVEQARQNAITAGTAGAMQKDTGMARGSQNDVFTRANALATKQSELENQMAQRKAYLEKFGVSSEGDQMMQQLGGQIQQIGNTPEDKRVLQQFNTHQGNIDNAQQGAADQFGRNIEQTRQGAQSAYEKDLQNRMAMEKQNTDTNYKQAGQYVQQELEDAYRRGDKAKVVGILGLQNTADKGAMHADLGNVANLAYGMGSGRGSGSGGSGGGYQKYYILPNAQSLDTSSFGNLSSPLDKAKAWMATVEKWDPQQIKAEENRLNKMPASEREKVLNAYSDTLDQMLQESAGYDKFDESAKTRASYLPDSTVSGEKDGMKFSKKQQDMYKERVNKYRGYLEARKRGENYDITGRK